MTVFKNGYQSQSEESSKSKDDTGDTSSSGKNWEPYWDEERQYWRPRLKEDK